MNKSINYVIDIYTWVCIYVYLYAIEYIYMICLCINRCYNMKKCMHVFPTLTVAHLVKVSASWGWPISENAKWKFFSSKVDLRCLPSVSEALGLTLSIQRQTTPKLEIIHRGFWGARTAIRLCPAWVMNYPLFRICSSNAKLWLSSKQSPPSDHSACVKYSMLSTLSYLVKAEVVADNLDISKRSLGLP